MSDNLPEKKLKTYFITNDNGTWEEIDELGNTIRIQKSKTFEPEISEDKRWIEIQDPRNPQKVILVDRRLPHDEYKNILLGRKGMPYSQEYASIICDKIINGTSLKKISEQDDMPSYSIITRWRLQRPEFNDQILEAYRMRAEKYMDDALEIALETDDPDNIVGSEKLKVDALRVQASFDSQRFNSKGNVSAKDGGIAIQVNITTGVSESEYAKKAAERKLSETGQVIDISKNE